MRVLELFAGAGGAALGLEAAGLEHAALVEQDADACATLRAAGLGPVIEGNAEAVDFSEWQGVEVVWASPPCQKHSRAGDGTGFDGWPVTLRCLEEVRPTWVLVENVVGAPVHQWCAELAELGFTAQPYLLDACRYGVPQSRERWFIVAGPYTCPPPGPSMRQCPAERVVPVGWLRAEGIGARGRPTSRPSPTVTKAGNLYWYKTDPGRRRSGDRVDGGRRVTVEELAGLQGFERHPWQGTRSSWFRQVGNAVPPALAQAVASVLP